MNQLAQPKIDCYICKTAYEMPTTLKDDQFVPMWFAITLRNNQFPVCEECYKRWNSILETFFSVSVRNKCVPDLRSYIKNKEEV